MKISQELLTNGSNHYDAIIGKPTDKSYLEKSLPKEDIPNAAANICMIRRRDLYDIINHHTSKIFNLVNELIDV